MFWQQEDSQRELTKGIISKRINKESYLKELSKRVYRRGYLKKDYLKAD
jgi:hypothetical protein